MFYQILISPQVNRGEIITYKNGIYELPHKLPNDLRLRNYGNLEILGKFLNLIEWPPSAQPQCQNKNFVISSQKVTKNSDQTYPVVRSFSLKL